MLWRQERHQCHRYLTSLGMAVWKPSLPKALRSQIIEFLIEIKSLWGARRCYCREEGRRSPRIAGNNAGVLGGSHTLLYLCRKERNHSELTDNINKMRPKCITLKAKKTPISKTFNVTKCGAPSRGRQFEGKLKTMRKQGQPLAVATPKAISSPMSVSLDMKVHNRTKVETDMPEDKVPSWSYNGKGTGQMEGSPCPHSRPRGKRPGRNSKATWRSTPEFPAPYLQCSPY